jgi:hypothetical protein
LKKACTFLVSLITVFLLIILSLSLFIRFRLYNPGYYLSIFEKNNLSGYVKQSIDNDYENLAREDNLGANSLNGIINKNFVNNSFNNMVYNTINYMTYKSSDVSDIKTDALSNSAVEKLKSYAAEKGLPVSNNQIEDVKQNVSTIAANEITFLHINNICNYSIFQKVRQAFFKLYNMIYFIVLFILLSIIIMALLCKKGEFLSHIGLTFIFSGLIVSIPMVVGLFMGFMNNIAIESKVYISVISNIIRGYFSFFIIYGFILILIGGIIYCIYNKKSIS